MGELQAAILRQNHTVIDIPGYKIERTLGKGGMASVYLAIQESFEREVALKIMAPSLSEDGNFSERFLREAKIVSRLVHPNIVTVYDVGVHNQRHYLSMEYIPGEDLKHNRKQLDFKQSLQVIRDVARALDYASKKGYVHRDVKPENIMLHEDDGRSVLMDFGIACLSDTTSGMTQTGTAIGTPHYMSPEQAKGRAVDPRSDIYSLGVVLFLLIAGHVPFDADSAVAVGIKHVSADIPRLPRSLAILQPIIDKVLAKEPGVRYQTGTDLIDAIEQITAEDIAAIEALSGRSPATSIDTKNTVAPTVFRQAPAAVKSAQHSPDLTTLSAAALATKPTAKVTSKTGATNGVTGGQQPVTGSQSRVSGTQSVVARTQRQPVAGAHNTVANKTTSGARKSVSAKTPLPGANPVPGMKNGVKPGRPQSNPGLRSDTGTQAKVKRKNLNDRQGESLFVDEEDRREHNHEPVKSRTWPWLVAAGLLLATGGLYFRAYLPVQLAGPMDNVAETGMQLKNDIFQELGWSVPPAQIESPPVASVGNSRDDNSRDESASADNSAVELTAPDADIAALVNNDNPSPENLLPEDQGVMGQASSLREGMKNDLSLAPQLAQMYRDILRESPEMKNAELGLRDVREYHQRFIRDAMEQRDLTTAKRYITSLEASFPGELDDDGNHLAQLERLQQAEQAQEHIDKATNYLLADALSAPQGANALESYQQALSVDAGNPLALAGLQQIVSRYVELSRDNFANGNIVDAMQSTNRGLVIDSNNVELLKIQQDSGRLLERRSKIGALLSAARAQLDRGNLIEPKNESAFDRYNELLTFDRGNSDAKAGLQVVERQLAFQVEGFINRNQFDQARQLIDRTTDVFPGSERMEALNRGLALAVEADFIARQPKISQLLITNQVPSSIDQAQEETINVERTIHIGFRYANFVAETSVVQAALYDGSRTVQIAQVPVVVSGKDGVKFFQIDRPVEGFSEGGYNIDLVLDNNKLHSSAFKVANK